MEYFDVFDKNRTFLNKILPRGTKLSPDEFNQGCEVFIILPDNKLLITQRCELKSHPFMWEAPGGCTITNETTLENAVREISEEIGLDINAADLQFLSTQLYKYQFVDIYKVNLDNLNINDLKLQDSEISQAKIVSFDEFEKLIAENKVVKWTASHYYSIKDKL